MTVTSSPRAVIGTPRAARGGGDAPGGAHLGRLGGGDARGRTDPPTCAGYRTHYIDLQVLVPGTGIYLVQLYLGTSVLTTCIALLT